MNESLNARFDTKMSVLHKKLLEEAARLKGFKSLSEYVITTMVADAKSIIDSYSSTMYSYKDKEAIMDILNEPTELSDSFRKASKNRKEKLD